MDTFGISAGISGIRHRQRSLTRVVLALFCLAWLQVAAMPCVMAHAAESVESQECGHCPWHSDQAPSCDDGQCSYPHDPQVDVRAAVPLFVPLGVGSITLLPAAEQAAPCVGAAVRPPDIPRPAVSIVHCRFLK
jgi:hypothetical protein